MAGSSLKQQPGRCIFCGHAGGMSKQHLFADRFKKLVPRKPGGYDKIRTTIDLNSRTNTNTIKPERPISDAAHPGTKKLRIVCKVECNEGWMNKAEQAAFDFLGPLVTSGEAVLDSGAQKAISLYMAIFFCMADREHLPTSGITQQERTHIYEHKDVPENWFFFIGRSVNDDWQYRFRHFGGDLQLGNAVDGPKLGKFQICTAGVGHLIMQAITSREVCMISDPVTYARAAGLALIHPAVGEINMAMLPWLSGEDVAIAADAVAAVYSAQGMPRR